MLFIVVDIVISLFFWKICLIEINIFIFIFFLSFERVVLV